MFVIVLCNFTRTKKFVEDCEVEERTFAKVLRF